MAVRNPPSWVQGGSHPAEHDRLVLSSLVPTEGVVGFGDLQVTQLGTPAMSVSVAAGTAFVKNDLATYGGTYHVVNDAALTVAITASNPTNPRRDLIVARVRDASYSGGANDFALTVIAGTPAATPVDPAIPADASYLVLARVAVAAAASTVTDANITDLRARAAVPGSSSAPIGSMLPYAGTAPPAGWLGADGTAVSRTTYAALFAVMGTVYGPGDGSSTFNLPNMKGRVPVGLDAAQAEFDTLGETGGTKTHTLTVTEMPSHAHTVNSHAHGGATTGGPNLSHQHAFTTDPNGTHSHNVGAAQPGSFIVAHQNASAANGLALNPVEKVTFTDVPNAGSHTHTGGTDFRLGAHEHNIPAESPATNAQGGGGAHNNLQPYAVVNFIIRAF